jgi:hypothetical protein
MKDSDLLINILHHGLIESDTMLASVGGVTGGALDG